MTIWLIQKIEIKGKQNETNFCYHGNQSVNIDIRPGTRELFRGDWMKIKINVLFRIILMNLMIGMEIPGASKDSTIMMHIGGEAGWIR